MMIQSQKLAVYPAPEPTDAVGKILAQQQLEAFQAKQRSRYAVRPGARMIAVTGEELREGAAVSLAHVGGDPDLLQELVFQHVISEVPVWQADRNAGLKMEDVEFIATGKGWAAGCPMPRETFISKPYAPRMIRGSLNPGRRGDPDGSYMIATHLRAGRLERNPDYTGKIGEPKPGTDLEKFISRREAEMQAPPEPPQAA